MFDARYSEKLIAAAGEKRKEEKYWLNKLSGEIVKSTFPYDYKRKSTGKRTNEAVTFTFTDQLFSTLMKLTNHNHQALYVILVMGLAALLDKYTGGKDIIVGSPILRQTIKKNVINKVLALRFFLEEEMTFKEFLLQANRTIKEAIENRNYPIEVLIQHLGLSGQESREDFPLFAVGILLENIHDKSDINHINTDISFSFLNSDGNINGQLEFNSSLYRKETIETIASHFKIVLEQSLSNLDSKVSALDILTAEEKNQLLYEFNDTAAVYPGEKTIQQLFEDQVERTPDGVAVVGSWQLAVGNGEGTVETETVGLTYRELNKRANQLAHVLRRKGAEPDTTAALMMERTVDMIVAIMAILKAGGAYLPINPDFPQNRIVSMLEDCRVSILVSNNSVLHGYSFVRLQGLRPRVIQPCRTAPRPLNKDFDGLPFVDRSLINNEKYNRFIGHGMVKNSVTLQATRGCPYDCAFCCRVWPRKLAVRSAENIFQEVNMYYEMGIRRFVFIDDIFNFDNRNSRRFFELVIENSLDIHILFPSGLRGDILTKDYIDLMVKAGTISFPLSLETASPRLQKLIKKNLDLKKFRENIEYIAATYPHVVLELNTIHGLPTETEEEARMTLDFIKSLKYVHFPYVHILRIHSNTVMEKLALENGISMEAIQRSRDMFYHELPDTLPFDKSFTLKYQAEFLNEYFLSKERLLHVLPFQMKALTEDEIVQKYNSYLPTPIRSFSDFLEFVDIKEEELGAKGFADEARFYVPNLDEKMRERFPAAAPARDALRVLLLDLSQFYSHESETLYDVVEQPLGLMYVMSYLKQRYGKKINGKIARSRIDFDSDEGLRRLIRGFNPDVIGVRTLTMYRDFFHRSVARIRQWGFRGAVIGGGPYATVDYNTLLYDGNIDLAVVGEGEITFAELIGQIMENGGVLPGEEVLAGIAGLAFMPRGEETGKEKSRPWGREVLMLDVMPGALAKEPVTNPVRINQSSHLAYIAYTSGSTGSPRGVMVEHKNVGRLIKNTNYIDINPSDNILQLSNYAFDGSVFDIYGALLNGSKLVMVKEDELLDVDKLSALMRDEKITVFFVTTALFNVLVDTHMESFGSIRRVLFGGERVSFEHVKQALDYMGKDRIIHVYGPTETTVYATYHYVRGLDEDLRTVPIGQPLANTAAYILDKAMKPVPVGAAGEIYIGGDAVARGYLNHEELTAEKFVANPFVEEDRLYKTGDLARRLPGGQIEFLGRLDDQVKLRGFRVEVGEIESALLRLDEIREAVVMTKENTGRDKFLCAYIVLEEGVGPVDFTGIKGRLSENLPDFMIPAYFIELEEIPLNANGKIDKRVLPDPEVKAGEDYIAPRNDVEKKLVDIWADVLKMNRDVIGIRSNFFELGGHSLKATILISRIHKTFNVKIPLAELFRAQTIAALSGYINGSEQERHISIEPVEKREYYELSSAQKRIYILRQMDPRGTAYNMPGMINLGMDTGVDKDRLERTFAGLIKRHEGFRTSFEMVNEEPVQRIHDNVDFAIEYYDLTGGNEVQNSTFIIQNSFVKPFDLSKAPLLRVGLISTEKNKILLIDMHHILSDGTSHEVLKEEFQAIYNGEKLPGLRLQYKDYAEWQNSEAQERKTKKQEEYWIQRFSDELPVLDLPTDYQRPPMQSFAGNLVDFSLNPIETEIIRTIARRTDATLFMVILAIYNILLFKLSGQEDIIVGTPIAARRHADLQPIIGMFVNTLALRNCPSRDKAFLEFVNEVKQTTLAAFENQEYQFDDLVDKLIVERDVSRNPIFDAAFNFLNQAEYPGESLNGDEMGEYTHQQGISKFDITLTGKDPGECIALNVNYCAKLFKPATIDRFIRYFRKIIVELSIDIERKISDITILSEEERQQLFDAFNSAQTGFPGEKSIYELFEDRAERAPDRTAVVGGLHPPVGGAGDDPGEPAVGECHLTYRVLNRRANRLARALRAKNVGPGGIVALMVGVSIEMVIGIIGILKSGAVYLPLAPGDPMERKDYMLNHSRAQVLLAAPQFTEGMTFGGDTIHILDILDRDPALSKDEDVNLDKFNHPHDIAYIIYTSGSTGKPRGVMTEHVNIANQIFGLHKAFGFDSSLHHILMASVTFDPSVQHIFLPLSTGGTLFAVSRAAGRDMEELWDYLVTRQVDIINAVPAVMNLLCDAALHAQNSLHLRFKYIMVGGEAFSTELYNKLKENLSAGKILNIYGPTECTINSTLYECMPDETNGVIPIGKPVINYGAWILDEGFQLVPPGVAGEICISGKGIAAGYLNNPQLTKEKFVENTFAAGERMYRTGDRGRWRADGNIEFLGRIDRQVKMRGIRIEPGEIETRLLGHDMIKDAVVVEKEGKHNDKYLCAYVVFEETGPAAQIPNDIELKNYLARGLPDYMIPSYITALEKIPLTSNGKVNIKALPGLQPVPGEDYIAPRNEIETKLVEIWSGILNVEKEAIGIHSNFFELGGHSLKATTVISRIHKEFNVKLQLARMFRNPTIEGIASMIEVENWLAHRQSEVVPMDVQVGEREMEEVIL